MLILIVFQIFISNDYWNDLRFQPLLVLLQRAVHDSFKWAGKMFTDHFRLRIKWPAMRTILVCETNLDRSFYSLQREPWEMSFTIANGRNPTSEMFAKQAENSLEWIFLQLSGMHITIVWALELRMVIGEGETCCVQNEWVFVLQHCEI